MAETQTATALARPPVTAYSWKSAGIAIGALVVFDVLINVYERLFALSKGLDYTSADYSTYWMSM
uniref:methane monooxygenase/ammonia monooxygenase subunit C n=1 Tax=Verrucomicrobium sp. 3C TaxID=1134055 RepID=UPI000476EB89